MNTYKITIGTGLYLVREFEIEVEERECEQDAIDKLIDYLEAGGNDGLFLSEDELSEYGEDMYICGGNHGRYLLHSGCLHIENLNEREN